MCYRSFDLMQEGKLSHNLVKQIREELLMSKAELARKSRVSALTIS
jgi:DNA-binding XRE family transcriptional regulator